MSKRIKLDLSKESDREIALKWLEESDEEFIEREVFSDVLELEDNLEVESSAESTIEVDDVSSKNFSSKSGDEMDPGASAAQEKTEKWQDIRADKLPLHIQFTGSESYTFDHIV
ncbi:hypothetical protein FQA39_LY02016 [Lamprigera yunnana]|nr:hypothetical protein FQA39_LY02016 [Lamprigera yunnana]